LTRPWRGPDDGRIRDLGRFFDELGDWAYAAGIPAATYRYGPTPEHEADLRLPAGPGPFPVVVVLHGGFWQAEFTRTIMSAAAVAITQEGWATWNVEYRRIGAGGGIPETLDDVAAAVRALETVDAPIQRDAPVTLGHSAGGQLALCLAGIGSIAAAVALAAVCDLAAAARSGLGDGAAVQLAGGTPDEVSNIYALADPIARLPVGVPQILVHGERDDRVPIDQSRAYAARARASGDPCELVALPGVGHFELIDPRASEWSAVMAALAKLRTR
jgi:acetyl esterase/lipase